MQNVGRMDDNCILKKLFAFRLNGQRDLENKESAGQMGPIWESNVHKWDQSLKMSDNCFNFLSAMFLNSQICRN